MAAVCLERHIQLNFVFGNNPVSDMTLLNMRAESFKRCVDQIADGQDEKSDEDAISEIATICILTFGY